VRILAGGADQFANMRFADTHRLSGPGHYGIYLINQLMDDVWYDRGGTEIHMCKR
jgi:anti-sigma regulatory factor (Ser/Thr protein kinase)